MNKLTFNGKGQTNSVDHINRLGFDNRKENLRFQTQAQQNFNQKREIRTAILPENCNFTWENVPKNVWYCKPTKHMSDRFCVQIKNVPDMGTIKWRSTGVKNVSLKFKLEHAKKYLRNLKEKNPDIFTNRNISCDYNEKAIDLIKDYNKIIKLSKFVCVKDCLVEIPQLIDLLEENLDGLTDEEKQMLKNISVDKTNNRSNITFLPENCGVTVDMIPKYCYYTKENTVRGDSFNIDKGHPKVNGKALRTSTSKKTSTSEKFIQFTNKLDSL
jgi:hypothetical protein